MAEGQAHHFYDETVSAILTCNHLDLACIMEEHGEIPPILFEELSELKRWATNHSLTVESITSREPPNSVRVMGNYSSEHATLVSSYSQIWVRVSYTRYASALRKFTFKKFGLFQPKWNLLHADHIINRGVLKACPDAWVNLFPVPAAANSPFGWRVEKTFKQIQPGFGHLNLPPLVAFKLFCGRMPSNAAELNSAMDDINGKLMRNIPLVDRFCSDMQNEIKRFF